MYENIFIRNLLVAGRESIVLATDEGSVLGAVKHGQYGKKDAGGNVAAPAKTFSRRFLLKDNE